MREQLLYASLHNLYLLHKTDKTTVVSDLMGLQAQFLNNPKYALQIRASDYSQQNWAEGLIKTWTFRGTLHVVLESELSLFLSATGLEKDWDDRWGMDRRLKPFWAEKLRDWIADGISEREALKKRCREEGMEPEVLKAAFHSWGGLLNDMSRRGMIACDAGSARRYVLCSCNPTMDRQAARMELIRRYFKTYGPATFADCAYFTGFRQTEVVRLVEAAGLPLKSVSYEGKQYFYLDNLPSGGSIPDCLFLTGFDQLVLGYRERSRFLDEEDKTKVTTMTGIVVPTILLRGRIKAKWKKDGGRLSITPFRRLKKAEQKLIADKAHEIFGEELKQVSFLQL